MVIGLTLLAIVTFYSGNVTVESPISEIFAWMDKLHQDDYQNQTNTDVDK